MLHMNGYLNYHSFQNQYLRITQLPWTISNDPKQSTDCLVNRADIWSKLLAPFYILSKFICA